jgi:YD repeat-containing protein
LTHDQAGHLSGASGSGATQSWAYDGNNNLTSAVSGTTTITYTDATGPQTENELLSLAASGAGAAANYGYDQNGNTEMEMSRPSSAGTLQSGALLSYDLEGRLVSTTSIAGTVVSQSYNAQGLRASYSVTPAGATVPLTNEQFLYSGGQLTQMVMTVSGTPAYTRTNAKGIYDDERLGSPESSAKTPAPHRGCDGEFLQEIQSLPFRHTVPTRVARSSGNTLARSLPSTSQRAQPRQSAL